MYSVMPCKLGKRNWNSCGWFCDFLTDQWWLQEGTYQKRNVEKNRMLSHCVSCLIPTSVFNSGCDSLQLILKQIQKNSIYMVVIKNKQELRAISVLRKIEWT